MGNPTEGQRTIWVVGHVNWHDASLGMTVVESEEDATTLIAQDMVDHDEIGAGEHPDWHLSAVFNDGECMSFGGPFNVEMTEPGQVP